MQPIADLLGVLYPGTWKAVTPSDTTVLSGCVGIWVGSAGNVAVEDVNGNAAVTLLSVPAGTLIRGRFSKVMNTNTTASNIVALGTP